jgi:hypothetical protein
MRKSFRIASCFAVSRHLARLWTLIGSASELRPALHLSQSSRRVGSGQRERGTFDECGWRQKSRSCRPLAHSNRMGAWVYCRDGRKGGKQHQSRHSFALGGYTVRPRWVADKDP